ncbi:MAG TPA: efflux RND transporter periplasmic adaptor subunit, partial [Gammaproteobacteria bacterium]
DATAQQTADLHISPAMINALGVRTVDVGQGTLAHPIEAVGYVGYDEDSMRAIHTRADGWIEKLAINSVGDRVHAGQLLYQLFSPKLATAEREYLIALAGGNQEMIQASAARLRSLGFADAQIENLRQTRQVHDRVARYAEAAGVVTELGIREGSYVTPATPVMKFADLGKAWILVEADESDAALLATGQRANAVLDAFPGRVWHGTVDHIYPVLDPVTRTIKVRLRFANPGERLQPNMYAHVSIQAAPQTDAVSIPSQALIRTGQSQRVVIALGNGDFDVCPVQAGYESGDQVQILGGLHPGQQVVVSAQFMLDSEANLDAAALRMGSNRSACAQLPAKVAGHQHATTAKGDRS